MANLLSGSTEECFSDMAKRFEWTNERRQLLTDFCDVERPTLTKWLNGSSGLPIGEGAARLRCFMQLLGYRVQELVAVDRTKRQTIYLVALNIVSAEAILQEVKFPQFSQLWKLLQSPARSPKAEPKLEALVETNAEQINRNIQLWGAFIRESFGVNVAQAVPAAPEAPPQPVMDATELTKLFGAQVAFTTRLAKIVQATPGIWEPLATHTGDGDKLRSLHSKLEELLDGLEK